MANNESEVFYHDFFAAFDHIAEPKKAEEPKEMWYIEMLKNGEWSPSGSYKGKFTTEEAKNILALPTVTEYRMVPVAKPLAAKKLPWDKLNPNLPKTFVVGSPANPHKAEQLFIIEQDLHLDTTHGWCRSAKYPEEYCQQEALEIINSSPIKYRMTPVLIPTNEKFFIELGTQQGSWVRSMDFPGEYSQGEAHEIIAKTMLTGVGPYRMSPVPVKTHYYPTIHHYPTGWGKGSPEGSSTGTIAASGSDKATGKASLQLHAYQQVYLDEFPNIGQQFTGKTMLAKHAKGYETGPVITISDWHTKTAGKDSITVNFENIELHAVEELLMTPAEKKLADEKKKDKAAIQQKDGQTWLAKHALKAYPVAHPVATIDKHGKIKVTPALLSTQAIGRVKRVGCPSDQRYLFFPPNKESNGAYKCEFCKAEGRTAHPYVFLVNLEKHVRAEHGA